MAHLLFLSHAGADTERARHIAAAIEASSEAQKHGLKVWVDRRPDGPHRLQAGTPWQDELERAIATDSTARDVLLTSNGARNSLYRVMAKQCQRNTYHFLTIIAEGNVRFTATITPKWLPGTRTQRQPSCALTRRHSSKEQGCGPSRPPLATATPMSRVTKCSPASPSTYQLPQRPITRGLCSGSHHGSFSHGY